MNEHTPIIFIDDDEDDHLMFESLFHRIAPDTPLIIFKNGQEAINYLKASTQKPFLIISEVVMQVMSGLELRRQIEADPVLRKRAIPFIFFTHPIHQELVDEAYELTIQGFFEKKPKYEEMQDQLEAIVSYWNNCLHPNHFTVSD